MTHRITVSLLFNLAIFLPNCSYQIVKFILSFSVCWIPRSTAVVISNHWHIGTFSHILMCTLAVTFFPTKGSLVIWKYILFLQNDLYNSQFLFISVTCLPHSFCWYIDHLSMHKPHQNSSKVSIYLINTAWVLISWCTITYRAVIKMKVSVLLMVFQLFPKKWGKCVKM